MKKNRAGREERNKKRRVIRARGKIIKGVGESGSFLTIDWVAEGLKKCFSFSPFPGTLNLEIPEDVQKDLRLAGKERLAALQEGFCDAFLFRAVLEESVACGVVLPLVENYPGLLLEIVAPVHLKETLELKEGDELTVEIEIEA
jgi:riboflavin kinase